MAPHTEEESKPIEEAKPEDVLEGLDVKAPEKMVPETTETISMETTEMEITKTETEAVSFEFMTRETVETAPQEVMIEETPLPTTEEVPLKAAVPEVSEVITEETEIDIGEGEKVFEVEEELIPIEKLPRPEEELPTIETAPEEKPEEDKEVPVKEEVEEVTPTELESGEAPVFTTELTNINLEEGQPVRFVCVVIGTPRPEITWLLDDVPIEDTTTYKTEYHKDGTCVLVIDETFREDEGEYMCQATNIFGTAKTIAELTFRGKFKVLLTFDKVLFFYLFNVSSLL